MARRRRLPADPVEAEIVDLSHDGRGVAKIDTKAVFVHGALPGETVSFKYTRKSRHFDEGKVVEVIKPSAERVQPRCEHFGSCGGCALQHLQESAQIAAKQRTLAENLQRIGKVEPSQWLEPLTADAWGYRRKARLSVRHVAKKGRVLVGFREQDGRFVADVRQCEVLDPRIGKRLEDLSELVGKLSIYQRVPQIEAACGDDLAAIVVRHLEPLEDDDLEHLRRFADDTGIAVYLQPKGPATIHALQPEDPKLSFRLPAYDLELTFTPANFIQVNTPLNRLMIDRALELLQAGPKDRVLDLFCGLGNFTLPLARQAGEVVGVEGDQALVDLACRNAADNRVDNVRFVAADLTEDPGRADWLQSPFDKVLLDPPRSGAREFLPHLLQTGATRIVYVSCQPASLARDAGILVNEYGFTLEAAGVMDMFPHTGHVESIALFSKH